MATSFVVSIGLQRIAGLKADDPRQFAWTLLITVGASTVASLAVTWLTAPEDEATLLNFYRRVNPTPRFWGPIARQATDVSPPKDEWLNLRDWFAGCAMIYLTLFGCGNLLFGRWGSGFLLLIGATVAGGFVYHDLTRRGWKVLEGDS